MTTTHNSFDTTSEEGTCGLLQLKRKEEIVYDQQDESKENVLLNLSRSGDYQSYQNVENADFNSKHLEERKHIINSSFNHVIEKWNFDLQATEEKSLITLAILENEKKIIKNEPDQFKEAVSFSTEQLKISQEISSTCLQLEKEKEVTAVKSDTLWLAGDTEITNSHLNQAMEEINPSLQHFQEAIETTDKQTEEEKNCGLLQPTQENQTLNIQQDEVAAERIYSSDWPKLEKEIAGNPDRSVAKTNTDSNAKADSLDQLEENAEFDITDSAEYDPGYPTEDNCDISSSSANNQVVETGTNDDAAKTVIIESKGVDGKSEKSRTDPEKSKMLNDLETQIIQNKLNLSSLPPAIWKTLKRLSGAQQKAFLRSMREKLEKIKENTGQLQDQTTCTASSPINEAVKQEVINSLTNNLLQWLAEHWGLALERNAGDNIMNPIAAKNPYAKSGKPLFSYTQRRKFMKNVKKLIIQKKMDPNNLPSWVWNSLKRLKTSTKFQFLKAIKQKAAEKTGVGELPKQQSPSKSKIGGFNSPYSSKGRSSSQSVKLPLHSLNSRFQTQAAKNKTKGKNKSKTYGKSPPPSFDNNFQTRWSRGESVANVATSSQVSPNLFSNFSRNRYFETSTLEKPALERNTLKGNTKSSSISFSDNSQTGSRNRYFKTSAPDKPALEKSTFRDDSDPSFIPFNDNSQSPSRHRYFETSALEKPALERNTLKGNAESSFISFDDNSQTPSCNRYFKTSVPDKPALERSTFRDNSDISFIPFNDNSQSHHRYFETSTLEKSALERNTLKGNAESSFISFNDNSQTPSRNRYFKTSAPDKPALERSTFRDNSDISLIPFNDNSQSRHRYFETSTLEKPALERNTLKGNAESSFISFSDNSQTPSGNRYFEISIPEKPILEKSPFEGDTQPSFISFNDNSQTPMRKESTFGGPSSRFSYSSHKSKEGANRPYFAYNSNFQGHIYDNSQSRNVGYLNRDRNFKTQNNGNTTRRIGKNPYGYRYAEDLQMQGGFRRATSSHRDVYGSPEVGENKYRHNLKRKLNDCRTSCGSHQPKRSNVGPSNQFGNANDNTINVVIADDSTPRGTMSEKQAAVLSAKLVQSLDQVSLSSQIHIPRFYNSGFLQGVFRITCSDQQSLDWLRQTVANLPELWRGAKLRVGAFTQFTQQLVKVSVFIPGLTDDLVVLFQRLERQNPGLNTGAWRVFRQTGNNKGQVLFIEIDEPSAQVLRKMDFKAFLGLSCITFQVPDYNSKKGKGKKH